MNCTQNMCSVRHISPNLIFERHIKQTSPPSNSFKFRIKENCCFEKREAKNKSCPNKFSMSQMYFIY